MTTLKAPVLVVLPPTHRCADLGRVLTLTRKAFGNPSLSIADLNVQFESVSSQDLMPASNNDEAADFARDSSQEPLEPRNHGPWSNGTSHSEGQSWAQAHGDRKEAVDLKRSAEVAAQPTPAVAMAQHIFHSTQQPLPARSLCVASSTDRGSEVGTIAAPAPESTQPFGQHSSAAPSSIPQQHPPPAPSGPLPDAHPSHWCLIVGNLNGNLCTNEILDAIVPRGMSLTGAKFHSPVASGPNKSGPLVRYVKLAFSGEADAHACHAWVKQEAEMGGIVYGMVAPGIKVHLGNPIRPVSGAAEVAPPGVQGPVAKAMDAAERASVNDARGPQNPLAPLYRSSPSLSPSLSPSPSPAPVPMPTPIPARPISSAHLPDAAAVSPLPEANPKAAYRLSIGNLQPDLSPTQLLSGLIPRGIRPVGLTLAPPQQLVGRDDRVRRVLIEFVSKLDLEQTYEYVKAQDGRVAALVAPRTKLVVAMSGVAPPVKVKASAVAAGVAIHNAPGPVSSSSSSMGPDLATSDFPEASPSAFRLHISNLLPTLEVPQILAALVPPKGVTVLGVSMFTPRPLSGSKRDILVRSLKLAFATEMEAKKCVDWIKKDPAGAVAKIVVKGAKITVGNPMAPME